jgi:dTDP-4-amino-4,6-dideoxygalactose transaminase
MPKLKKQKGFWYAPKPYKGVIALRDLINIVEDKECQTPGANYRFETTDDSVTSTVTLPFKLNLTEEQVKKLENELHDSLEQVFKQFF